MYRRNKKQTKELANDLIESPACDNESLVEEMRQQLIIKNHDSYYIRVLQERAAVMFRMLDKLAVYQQGRSGRNG